MGAFRYLTEEELKDSLVVDSEGYICGKVDSLKVEPDKILINLYGTELREVKVPDEKKLIEKLIASLPLKRSFIGGKPSREALYNQIRNELGLAASQRVSLKELTSFAEAKGISVPSKIERKVEKIGRGSVDWNLIEKIGKSELGKCILLKNPVEAERRGIQKRQKVPYYGTEYLKGRMVIDRDAQIIGSAEKLLLKVDAPPGLLFRQEKLSRIKSIDLDALVKKIVPSQLKTEISLYKTIAQDLGLKGRFTVEEMKNNYLVSWAQSKGIEVPKKVEEKRETIREIPVDWNDIKKIGDVVLLNRTIDEILKPPEKVEEPQLPKKAPSEKPGEATEITHEGAEKPVEKEERLEEEWWREYLTPE